MQTANASDNLVAEFKGLDDGVLSAQRSQGAFSDEDLEMPWNLDFTGWEGLEDEMFDDEMSDYGSEEDTDLPWDIELEDMDEPEADASETSAAPTNPKKRNPATPTNDTAPRRCR